jgi:NAD(P)-dependent dehydrogenase (short-subunit alcohol dehydrogenase family)
MRLAKKVAIVTGAARGIGAAYAMALAREGASVAVCDVIDPAPVVKDIEKVGGAAIGMVADVLDASAIARVVDATAARFGTVHILVNNAALFAQLSLRPFYEIPADEWDKVMAVNVRGVVDCARAVLPHMRKQRYGKIINIASATVHRGTPMLMHYVASKGAVIALTRAMARELGEFGITANCIAPGFTLSERVRANPVFNNPGQAAATIASRAIKREQSPDDIVGTLIYLASPDSDFVTGQTVIVDGGVNMI